MKTSTLISFIIFTIAALIIAGSFAMGQDVYVVKEDEELFGTWINLDRDGDAKLVIEYNGTWKEYKRGYYNKPNTYAEYTITEKWTDSDGNTYYKAIAIDIEFDITYYILSKINKSFTVYEDVWSTEHMPSEFDPNNIRYHYRIYYRQ